MNSYSGPVSDQFLPYHVGVLYSQWQAKGYLSKMENEDICVPKKVRKNMQCIKISLNIYVEVLLLLWYKMYDVLNSCW